MEIPLKKIGMSTQSSCNFYFSWGDGDHGKLGHGSCDRLRKPRMITSLRGLGQASGTAEAAGETK